jgi:ribose-phosphate pyrophosphokinase
MIDAPLVFAMPGNGALALAIATHCGGDIGNLQLHRFSDGETGVRTTVLPAGRDAIIACTLNDPDSRMAALHFAAGTLREHGARRIVLAAPYLAYMRQDYEFVPGTGTLARHYARWLSSLFDGLVTVDPHLHRLHALREIFTIPTQVVSAASDVADWIAEHHGAPLLVGPDGESEQWVSAIARRLNCPYTCFRKERRGDIDVHLQVPQLLGFRGRQAIVVDDIASTGQTMLGVVEALTAAGFNEPVCIAVHAIFAGDACQQLLRAGAGKVLSCDTVGHPSNTISVRTQVAAATAAFLIGTPVPRAMLGLRLAKEA